MAATPPRPPEPTPGSDRLTVPKLNRDPVQSLCPFPVEIQLAGHDYLIPALPAAPWLSILMTEDVDLVDMLLGLLDQSQSDELADSILTGQVEVDELEETILQLIDTVSARPWWVALRLIEVARSSWDVLGAELGLKGVDAAQVSLSMWLDILLLVTLRSMDPKEVQMFCLKLEAPPFEVEAEEPEMSESAFMAMAK